MEYFWNEKSKVLARIKPRFSFWLKINFRKITSNKHVDLRKPRSKGTESATRGVLQEKVFLETSQNSQANICASLFVNKVAGQAFGTGAFLWILRNFHEHLFYRISPDDCFWRKES